MSNISDKIARYFEGINDQDYIAINRMISKVKRDRDKTIYNITKRVICDRAKFTKENN